jgi:hypothetical protein
MYYWIRDAYAFSVGGPVQDAAISHISELLVVAESRVQAAKRDKAMLQSVGDGSISHEHEPALSSTFAYDMVEAAGTLPMALAYERIEARMKAWVKVCRVGARVPR